ncbi:MAG: hypothetical protein ACKVU1_08080 [bacterium]
MNGFLQRKLVIGAFAGVVALAGLALIAASGPERAVAQQEIYLDWSDGPENCASGTPWLPPPTCSSWHEIAPAFCTDHHQDGFQDNGDGVVSVCDVITLDGADYHIVNAGPTLYLDCSGGGEAAGTTMILEPEGAYTGDPMAVEWFEVYPDLYGYAGTITSWLDNGDGELSVCDQVVIGGLTCHVKRVGCNIRVVPFVNANEASTWGKIKSFFGVD